MNFTYALIQENLAFSKRIKELTEENERLRNPDRRSIEDIDHYDFMDLPDYPEPPEDCPTDQLNYEEYDMWRAQLREFWAKHEIPISKSMHRDFGF